MKKNKQIKSKKGYFARKAELFMAKFMELQGDPHSVALGMAIGVYVGITPTIPFHTALAVALAFVFRCSKPAAVIGVWVCNPFTVLFFYLASYKTGMLLFGNPSAETHAIALFLEVLESPIPFSDKWDAVLAFLHTEADSFYAMMLGGFVIALPPGIATYFITKKFAMKLKN